MTKRNESIRIIAMTMFFIALVFFSTPLRNICAEQVFFINAGFGDVGVRMQDGHVRSDSHNTAYSMGLGVDLDKEDSPFRLSFRANFLFTNKDVESWDSASGGVHNENQLDIHGVTLGVHGYRMVRTCSIRDNTINITPYLGGGIVYRQLEFEREWFRGTMFPLSFPVVDTAYSLSDQRIVAVGGMPEAGVSVEFPQSGLECVVHIGWAFLAAKSDINYQVSVAGSESRYSFRSDSSGSLCMADMRIIKHVDSFSLMLGLAWERMTIDDKSVLLFDTSTDDAYLPFPELKVTHAMAWIGLTYPF